VIAKKHRRAGYFLGAYTAAMAFASTALHMSQWEDQDEERRRDERRATLQSFLNPFSGQFMQFQYGDRLTAITPMASYYRFIGRTLGYMTRQGGEGMSIAGKKFEDGFQYFFPFSEEAM